MRNKINLLIIITVTCVPYNHCQLILITIYFLFFLKGVGISYISDIIKASMNPQFRCIPHRFNLQAKWNLRDI